MIQIPAEISLCIEYCYIVSTYNTTAAWNFLKPQYSHSEARWLSGKFSAFHLEGRRFESHSTHHVGTLGKSFTRSCL